jgi:acetyl-CoA acyltransferase 1
MRAASTQARGLSAVLSKNPDDVVITFSKRTPIGRAKKGQFKDTPVDEILHGLFKVRPQDESRVQFVILCSGYTGAD